MDYRGEAVKRGNTQKQKSILLTNIQRFSLHDGPGIRTTVFLKGCSLRCPWCSNPENLRYQLEPYKKDGIEGTYGRWYSADELVHECLKDRGYYDGKLPCDLWRISSADQIEKLPGGVTFSGGEALLQVEALVPVCSSLHDAGVHIAVETALFVPEHHLQLALENIDFFYVDIKILNQTRCKEVEGGNLDLYLNNLDTLLTWKDAEGKGLPVVIRVPVIGGYTSSPENRKAVKSLIEKYQDRILKVELIKEHNLGESKYRSLNMEMHYTGVDDELMERYKAELDELGIEVEVCRI